MPSSRPAYKRALSAVDEGRGSVKKARAEATVELRGCGGFYLLASPLSETGKDWGALRLPPMGQKPRDHLAVIFQHAHMCVPEKILKAAL